MIRDNCEKVINEAWGFMGNMELGLRSVREKISRCGSDLEAWGATNTHPNEEVIKKVKKGLKIIAWLNPWWRTNLNFWQQVGFLMTCFLNKRYIWHNNLGSHG